MSSPFTTLEAFNGAADGPTEGAIYTFAQAPIFNYIALGASVALFFWFIIKTYSGHATEQISPPLERSSNNTLVPLIVAGLLSLFAADIRQSSRPASTEQNNRSQEPALSDSRWASNLLPVGLLGMMSVGGSSMRKVAGRRRRRSRAKYQPTKSIR